MKTFWKKWSGAALAVQLTTIGAILIMATAIAIPVMGEQRLARERSQAFGDLRRLAADIMNYHKDTGAWPDQWAFTFTDGDPAAGEEARYGNPDRAVHVSRFLSINKARVEGWRGPYMGMARHDPWGNRYVVVTGRPGPSRPVHLWVISAGPSGVFQTDPDDTSVKGDDLGLRLQ